LSNKTNLLKPPRDLPGYTFIVRPQLTLTDDVLNINPELMDLAEEYDYSLWKYIRGLLDPRWAYDNSSKRKF